jgi:hypothetical protein
MKKQEIKMDQVTKRKQTKVFHETTIRNTKAREGNGSSDKKEENENLSLNHD